MDAVHIVGAGGIGCAVGYALRAAGVAVLFVEANTCKVEAGQRDGVRVDDRSPLPADFVHIDDWKPTPEIWVLLCTKCYDNTAVLKRMSVPVRLLPIQNGFDPQLDGFGHDFEGIASFVSECDPNRPHTRITRRGELHFGRRLGNRETASAVRTPLRGLNVAAAREGLFRVVDVQDITPIKHTKLMYNAAISPLAAAAGIDNGKLLSVPAARKLFFDLLQENYRILSAAGIALGKVGPFHPKTVAWILRRTWLAGMMAKGFEPSLRGTYCSMAGEIQKGRTELDNYNGHLIRLAERAAVPCPLNRRLFALVNWMTAVRTQPQLEMLELLASHELEQSLRESFARSVTQFVQPQ